MRGQSVIRIEPVKIRREREDTTYNIERAGFAGLNLPQNLERAQNEITRLKMLGIMGGDKSVRMMLVEVKEGS